MQDFKAIYTMIREQENRLQFDVFNHETALTIGLMMIEKAKKEQKVITLDISRHNHQLFRYAFQGTKPEFDSWIAGKNKVLRLFHQSSLHIATVLKESGKTIEEQFHVSSLEYFASGGAFPIIVKNAGVIGSITVSGLREEDDHAFIVEVLEDYLKL